MLRRLIKACARATFSGLSRRVAFSRNGNVAIIAAFSMLPLGLAMGVGVDYAIQKRGQDQLDGIADAAALVATTPAMMSNSPSSAQTAANLYWSKQSATVFNVNQLTAAPVVVNDTVNGTVRTRTVTVTWSGTSNTFLSGLVGLTTLPLGDTIQASASAAPNINFYLLVDTSPSMAIPSTTAGISSMVTATGCAFGCHEANPSSDGLTQDGYSVARSLGIPLRIDLVNQAVSNLLSTAATMATTNLTTYGVSISTISYQFNPVYSTGNIAYTPVSSVGLSCATQTAANLSNVCSAQSALANSPNMQLLEIWSENCLFSWNCNYNNGGNDQDSLLDLGISTLASYNSATYTASNSCFISSSTSSNPYVSSTVPSNPCNTGTSNPTNGPGFQMYTPGSGTNNAGDTPQEILFIITDGVVDEYLSNTTGVASQYLNGSRVQAPINTVLDNCTAIKSKGIRIAFLYLVYNPLPGSWYSQYISPWQSQIATQAAACASPGLFQPVNTNQDISAALNSLFQTAVATAHLTQ